MMIKIEQLKMPLNYEETDLAKEAAKILGNAKISKVRILRKALDARKKDDLHFVLHLAVEVEGDEAKILKKCKKKTVSLYQEKKYILPQGAYLGKYPPIVVGTGPAGLFAALILAEKGANPIVIEQGKPVEERRKDIDAFLATGTLLPQSNIQFGEGGAGTFSDGKLTTGTKDFRHGYIIDAFIKGGAPKEIGYMAKPHIGSDYLPKVVKNIREEIISLGGTFRFETTFKDFETADRKITTVILEKDGVLEKVNADTVILATGHSSRDTYRFLHEKGVAMERKSFSLGVRIEHLQTEINAAQYGTDSLGAADYKLAVHLPNGGSAYTFCMCPGGVVVPAASEKGGVVTNGMSEFARNATNANSALLVGVSPEDFPFEGVLGGILWQEEIEAKAYEAGGKDYAALCQRVGDFLAGKPSTKPGAVLPSYLPKVTYGSIGDVLPPMVVQGLKEALPLMGQKLKGFDNDDALLTAPETRSSATLRILRDENCEASIKGLYPCGEGAGYAGGIMSSAADGIRVSEKCFGEYFYKRKACFLTKETVK